MSITDIDRWKQLSNSSVNPSWSDRNDVVASFIRPGSRVLDVGSGNRQLKTVLPANCEYNSVDCVEPNTFVYDFNSNLPPPNMGGHDVAVCSGVLEYILDPEKFLRMIKDTAPQMILTYAAKDHRSKAALVDPMINGWVNALSIEDLNRLFAKVSLKVIFVANWARHTVFNLEVIK